MASNKFESHAGGGDWAHAAEVFRKYDADGSGKLDKSELLAALRECDLLASVSAAAAGRALADMDTNGDGQISFEEFREAYSRLSRLKAAEQRQARFRARTSAPAVPPNAAVDPRLRAAFQAFASHGAAKGLSERTPRGACDAMASRQFQRICAAAHLPVQLESGALDVVFASHAVGRGRTLSFPRFLEAMAQVAHEAGLALEVVLEAVRSAAPNSTAPGKASERPATGGPAAGPTSDTRPSVIVSASPRPKSAACNSRPASGLRQGAAAAAAAALQMDAAAAALQMEMAAARSPPTAGPTAGAVPPLNKLQQRVVTLQQLLEEGPEELQLEEGEGSIPAHPGQAALRAAGDAPGTQRAQHTGDRLLLNPAFQGPEAGDLAAFRLQMLALLDQRCEATERSCEALVATRAEMAQALAHVSASLGGGASSAPAATAGQVQEALSAVHGLQEQLSAMEGRLSGAVRQAQECRAAVSVVEAQVEALQRSQDAALRKTNEAILCIARRVGALAATAGGQQKQAS